MKLRVSSKLQQSVRKYLEADARAQAKIFVTATYVTADGATATRKLTIRVRPV
jgi:ribosome-associated protein YbcJ (S4-like RNA binding protein)